MPLFKGCSLEGVFVIQIQGLKVSSHHRLLHFCVHTVDLLCALDIYFMPVRPERRISPLWLFLRFPPFFFPAERFFLTLIEGVCHSPYSKAYLHNMICDSGLYRLSWVAKCAAHVSTLLCSYLLTFISMEVKGGRRTKGLKITSWLPETAEEKRYLQHLITVTPPLHQNWCVYAKKHCWK